MKLIKYSLLIFAVNSAPAFSQNLGKIIAERSAAEEQMRSISEESWSSVLNYATSLNNLDDGFVDLKFIEQDLISQEKNENFSRVIPIILSEFPENCSDVAACSGIIKNNMAYVYRSDMLKLYDSSEFVTISVLYNASPTLSKLQQLFSSNRPKDIIWNNADEPSLRRTSFRGEELYSLAYRSPQNDSSKKPTMPRMPTRKMQRDINLFGAVASAINNKSFVRQSMEKPSQAIINSYKFQDLLSRNSRELCYTRCPEIKMPRVALRALRKDGSALPAISLIREFKGLSSIEYDKDETEKMVFIRANSAIVLGISIPKKEIPNLDRFSMFEVR